VESKANFIKLDFGNLLGKAAPGHKEKKVFDLFTKENPGHNSGNQRRHGPVPLSCKGSLAQVFDNREESLRRLLEFSGWNPPPKKRKMVGDYFYLKLVTYEKTVHFITAFCKGFYLNKSTDQLFDPSAASESFFSLLDLIASVSPHFK
jgi:hypothetical protein